MDIDKKIVRIENAWTRFSLQSDKDEWLGWTLRQLKACREEIDRVAREVNEWHKRAKT